MPTEVAVGIAPEEKLDLLRRLDEFRFWQTLDDNRLCQRCHQIMSGRQIEILVLEGKRGTFRLQCATADCAATPAEWIYVNPIAIAQARTAQSEAALISLRAGDLDAMKPCQDGPNTLQRSHEVAAPVVRPTRKAIESIRHASCSRSASMHILRPIVTSVRNTFGRMTQAGHIN